MSRPPTIVDNAMPNVPDLTNEERKSRMLIEKKTVINLLEAYAVHHLPSRHATLFHRTVKDALAVGSTGIHEASTDLDAVEFYKQIKLFVDGSLGSSGAALLKTRRSGHEPYEFGKTFSLTSSKDSTPTTARWRVPTLAGCDRTNRAVLDILEDVFAGTNLCEARPRIEHAQVTTSEDPERMRRLGECPNQILLGSDSPVEGVNPPLGGYAAVTRLSVTGRFPPPRVALKGGALLARPTECHLFTGHRYPKQRLTRFQALQGMTLGVAYTSFSESVTGSLAVGKKADFVILDRDTMTMPEPGILVTKVLAAVIDGEVVYGSL
ncbi:hypothetical protein EDD17DRAFT_1763581 [Pisolithus thermaeus]|nr:hypothetical protein EDD17DRAFT_1763581 [Pisolithus thermaeus]